MSPKLRAAYVAIILGLSVWVHSFSGPRSASQAPPAAGWQARWRAWARPRTTLPAQVQGLCPRLFCLGLGGRGLSSLLPSLCWQLSRTLIWGEIFMGLGEAEVTKNLFLTLDL